MKMGEKPNISVCEFPYLFYPKLEKTTVSSKSTIFCICLIQKIQKPFCASSIIIFCIF
jgi:hypothetical protein